MSIILVIDTAFEQCQAGLWRDGVCLCHESVTSGGQHDRVLASMVERILHDTGLGVAALDRIMVTTGPGRFTGLRVGIAFARGLALVHGTPLAGISTLDALALEMNARFPEMTGCLAVVASVKRGESFVQMVGKTGDGTGQNAVCRVMDEDFTDFFPSDLPVVLAGVVSPELQDILGGLERFSLVAGTNGPSLDAVYTAGRELEAMPPSAVRPFYTLAQEK